MGSLLGRKRKELTHQYKLCLECTHISPLAVFIREFGGGEVEGNTADGDTVSD